MRAFARVASGGCGELVGHREPQAVRTAEERKRKATSSRTRKVPTKTAPVMRLVREGGPPWVGRSGQAPRQRRKLAAPRTPATRPARRGGAEAAGGPSEDGGDDAHGGGEGGGEGDHLGKGGLLGAAAVEPGSGGDGGEEAEGGDVDGGGVEQDGVHGRVPLCVQNRK